MRRYHLEVEYSTKRDQHPNLSEQDLLAEVCLVLKRIFDGEPIRGFNVKEEP